MGAVGEGEIFIIDGSVAEWSKALVLGTSHFDGVGSNPTAAKFIFLLLYLRSFFFSLSFFFRLQSDEISSIIIREHKR